MENHERKCEIFNNYHTPAFVSPFWNLRPDSSVCGAFKAALFFQNCSKISVSWRCESIHTRTVEVTLTLEIVIANEKILSHFCVCLTLLKPHIRQFWSLSVLSSSFLSKLLWGQCLSAHTHTRTVEGTLIWKLMSANVKILSHSCLCLALLKPRAGQFSVCSVQSSTFLSKQLQDQCFWTTRKPTHTHSWSNTKMRNHDRKWEIYHTSAFVSPSWNLTPDSSVCWAF